MTDGAILIVKCNRQHSVTGDTDPDSASGEIRKQHMIAAEGSTNASFRETYAEHDQLLQVARFIHAVEHANDRAAIQ
jgi:hypothetical protein